MRKFIDINWLSAMAVLGPGSSATCQSGVSTKTDSVQTLVLVLFVAAVLGGCATYRTPAGGVDIPAITDADIEELLRVEPASPFPARIAIARVQASGYVSSTNRGYGTGRYSIVTTRDIEDEADFLRVGRLPMVGAVAPLNRLLIPTQLDSLKDLRIAAARVRTDLLLLYSLDTAFHVESTPLGPLSTITLGFLPNKEARVTSTTSGALIDVRTGFVYGVAEATETEQQRANVWTSQDVIDESRLRAEKASFLTFLSELETLWKRTVEEYASKES